MNMTNKSKVIKLVEKLIGENGVVKSENTEDSIEFLEHLEDVIHSMKDQAHQGQISCHDICVAVKSALMPYDE